MSVCLCKCVKSQLLIGYEDGLFRTVSNNFPRWFSHIACFNVRLVCVCACGMCVNVCSQCMYSLIDSNNRVHNATSLSHCRCCCSCCLRTKRKTLLLSAFYPLYIGVFVDVFTIPIRQSMNKMKIETRRKREKKLPCVPNKIPIAIRRHTLFVYRILLAK